jgi:hypothetical protein
MPASPSLVSTNNGKPRLRVPCVGVRANTAGHPGDGRCCCCCCCLCRMLLLLSSSSSVAPSRRCGAGAGDSLPLRAHRARTHPRSLAHRALRSGSARMPYASVMASYRLSIAFASSSVAAAAALSGWNLCACVRAWVGACVARAGRRMRGAGRSLLGSDAHSASRTDKSKRAAV